MWWIHSTQHHLHRSPGLSDSLSLIGPQEAKMVALPLWISSATWNIIGAERLLMRWLNPFSEYFHLQFIHWLIKLTIKNLLNAHDISWVIRTNKIWFLSPRTLQSSIKRGQIGKEGQYVLPVLWPTYKTRCMWDTRKGWPVLFEAGMKVYLQDYGLTHF